MTGSYLTNIIPDNLSGLLFALEGVERTLVVLNGPTGCKFYHASISDDQGLRQRDFDPTQYPMEYFFAQSRIPCTYLDKRDYIYGSRDKLEDLLTYARDHLDFDLLAVINSPGASLIGDNLEQIVRGVMGDRPAVIVESPGFSKAIWQGYGRACQELLAQVPQGPVEKKPGKRVNLLGLSIYQKYYQGDFLEIKRLLGLCGIEINCALCCKCTLAEIRALPQADLNLVLYPEYGLETAKLLEQRFGTPYVCGLPLGFAETERWIKEVCKLLDCDCGPVLQQSEEARARAYLFISRINSFSGMPKGVRYAVHGTCSQCLAFSRVLMEYFGMVPAALTVLDTPADNPVDFEALHGLLRRWNMEAALDRDILDCDAAVVFANATILAQLKLGKRAFTGIEIALPAFGYVDVLPKTHLGIKGALFLTEQVLNSLPF